MERLRRVLRAVLVESLGKAQEEVENLREQCARAEATLKAELQELERVSPNSTDQNKLEQVVSLEQRISTLTAAVHDAREKERASQERATRALLLIRDTIKDIDKKYVDSLKLLHVDLKEKLVGASILHQEASTILSQLEDPL